MTKVQIVYKSGHVQIVKCKKMIVVKEHGNFVKLEWEGMSPRPLMIGLDEIESIFELPRIFLGIPLT